MIGALVAVLAIIAIGGRAAGKLRTAQLESILSRLPENEARDFYAGLQRHVRRTNLLRLVAIVSLACIFYALRRSLLGAP